MRRNRPSRGASPAAPDNITGAKSLCNLPACSAAVSAAAAVSHCLLQWHASAEASAAPDDITGAKPMSWRAKLWRTKLKRERQSPSDELACATPATPLTPVPASPLIGDAADGTEPHFWTLPRRRRTSLLLVKSGVGSVGSVGGDKVNNRMRLASDAHSRTRSTTLDRPVAGRKRSTVWYQYDDATAPFIRVSVPS